MTKVTVSLEIEIVALGVSAAVFASPPARDAHTASSSRSCGGRAGPGSPREVGEYRAERRMGLKGQPRPGRAD